MVAWTVDLSNGIGHAKDDPGRLGFQASERDSPGINHEDGPPGSFAMSLGSPPQAQGPSGCLGSLKLRPSLETCQVLASPSGTHLKNGSG